MCARGAQKQRTRKGSFNRLSLKQLDETIFYIIPSNPVDLSSSFWFFPLLQRFHPWFSLSFSLTTKSLVDQLSPLWPNTRCFLSILKSSACSSTILSLSSIVQNHLRHHEDHIRYCRLGIGHSCAAGCRYEPRRHHMYFQSEYWLGLE